MSTKLLFAGLVAIWVPLSGCAPAPVSGDDRADDSVEDSSLDSDGACPSGSVAVADVCIDAFEAVAAGDLGNRDQGVNFPDGSTRAQASSQAGVAPTEHITWYQAFGVCAASGRHLCTVAEWQAACGAGTYPWGETPDAVSVCALANSDGSTSWTASQLTGALADCASAAGVHDQMGNLWEWADPGVQDADGRPMTAKLGGAWYAGNADAACNLTAHDEHPPDFDGSIGFRCCSPA
jgi:formylglycine-generating enzyme required for sulfatase activity